MWPDWIDELKTRYLAEEGSVFLLHGPGIGVARWPFEAELLDAGRLLARFLTLTRDIVVLYDPIEGRLGWGGIEDPGRFKRHTDAALTLQGGGARADTRVPEQALGLFWLSLHTQGANHGLVLYHTERLCPARRTAEPPPLGMQAPPLAAWNADPGLRESDNVVVLLASELHEVREDLRAGAVLIEVPEPPRPQPVMAAPVDEDPLSMRRRAPTPDEAAAEVEAALAQASDPGAEDAPDPERLAKAAEEVEDPLSMRREPDSASPPQASEAGTPATAPEPAQVGLLIEEALEAAVIRHPDGPPWPGHLPAREAVAEVLHRLAPERVGALTFEVEGSSAVAVGEGADWFNSWWAGDIAVDAACGMALSGLEKPPGGFSEQQPPRFPAAALRALTRRIEKALG